MAGRALLLVCALCALCCAAGGGRAWDMDYCTEENWEFLKLLNSSKNATELLDEYCRHNATFVAAIKHKLTATGGSAGNGNPGGTGEEKAPTRSEEGPQAANEESSSPTMKQEGDVNSAGGSSEPSQDAARGGKAGDEARSRL
ncbi:uncharacterized protein Tco025E_09908, partial [Trypanosoma conorhini]